MRLRMHKLDGGEIRTKCPAWLTNQEGFWASRWWTFVTCRRCLKTQTRKVRADG